MTASPHEILRVAATVWDHLYANPDNQSDADVKFVRAIARADRQWLDSLSSVKLTFGPGETFEAVKNLATRQRNEAYASAYAAHQVAEEADIMGDVLQAAE